MTDENLPDHSPLGASSAERWMNCPGSVKLIRSLNIAEETEEPEYRKEGSCAHEAAAYCIRGNETEPWEIVGDEFLGMEVTAEMADAFGVFVALARELEHTPGWEKTYIEAHLNDPDNKWLYGTIDFGIVHPGVLSILDYKHGQGIVVETKGNPQMLYYAYLILLLHPDIRKVRMRIVQPRVPFPDQEWWEVSAEYVMEWAQKELLPAMARTETDTTLSPGDHCRFCPAKLACPALAKQYATVTKDDPKYINGMCDDDLMARYPLIATAKMYIKALEDETLRRLMTGGLVDNKTVKLVNKKANRVWKPEAFDVLKSRFGDAVMSEPEFKSPAEVEKIDATAKKMVHEYAYTPQTGYTVAPIDDRRPGVKPQTATTALSETLANIEN